MILTLWTEVDSPKMVSILLNKIAHYLYNFLQNKNIVIYYFIHFALKKSTLKCLSDFNCLQFT